MKENVITCSRCGAILNEEYANYFDDDEDYPYCRDCYERINKKVIKDCNYKPEPIFYGSENLFCGAEFEIDKCGG